MTGMWKINRTAVELSVKHYEDDEREDTERSIIKIL
jgi:hypothetical protein